MGENQEQACGAGRNELHGTLVRCGTLGLRAEAKDLTHFCAPLVPQKALRPPNILRSPPPSPRPEEARMQALVEQLLPIG